MNLLELFIAAAAQDFLVKYQGPHGDLGMRRFALNERTQTWVAAMKVWMDAEAYVWRQQWLEPLLRKAG